MNPNAANRKRKLLPFGPNDQSCAFSVDASIELLIDSLRLSFELQGNISQIKIPAEVAAPEARGELWKSTCFEFFASCSGVEKYLEFNFSPSKDWAIYAFDSYRKPSSQPVFESYRPNIKVAKSPQLVSLEVEIPSNEVFKFLNQSQELEISFTTVIETADHQYFYFAQKHLGEKPDFHLRKSFIGA